MKRSRSIVALRPPEGVKYCRRRKPMQQLKPPAALGGQVERKLKSWLKGIDTIEAPSEATKSVAKMGTLSPLACFSSGENTRKPDIAKALRSTWHEKAAGRPRGSHGCC